MTCLIVLTIWHSPAGGIVPSSSTCRQVLLLAEVSSLVRLDVVAGARADHGGACVLRLASPGTGRFDVTGGFARRLAATPVVAAAGSAAVVAARLAGQGSEGTSPRGNDAVAVAVVRPQRLLRSTPGITRLRSDPRISRTLLGSSPVHNWTLLRCRPGISEVLLRCLPSIDWSHLRCCPGINWSRLGCGPGINLNRLRSRPRPCSICGHRYLFCVGSVSTGVYGCNCWFRLDLSGSRVLV